MDRDEALDRLRAADPAAGVPADLGSLRRAVDSRLEDAQGGGGEPGRRTDDAGRDDELAIARRRRQGRRTAWVAAAAVAAVAFGTGGFAVGSAVGGDEAAPLPALQLAGGQSSADAGPATATTEAFAPRMGAWGGRTVFTSSGLSTTGAEAEAFAYDPAAVYSAETAARAAQVLGVVGEPREEGGAWMVGDFGGPVVQIHADGIASLSFSDPAVDPYACLGIPELLPAVPDVPAPGTAEGSPGGAAERSPGAAAEGSAGAPADGSAAGGSDGAVGSGSAEPVPALPGCGQEAPAAAPGNALDVAKAVLTDLGVPVGDYEWSVETFDPAVATVTGAVVRDGRMTGQGWNVSVAAGGVYSVWGSLAPRYSLGAYPVISPAEAVERLTDPRFGAGTLPMPVDTVRIMGGDGAGTPETEAPDTAVSSEPSVPTVPARVEPGSSIDWPVQEVTITGATLTLGQFTEADGAVVLLPAYELTDADGGTWSVLAVAEDRLAF